MAKKKTLKPGAKPPLKPRRPMPNPQSSIQEPITRGPAKQAKKGPPKERYTTHKTRAAWFFERAAYPLREARIEQLTDERARAEATLPTLPPGAPDWEMIGPSNIGGRTTSIAVHPTKPDIIYIGAAGGGVWKSTDAGKTWAPLWHSQPVLNIGSLAIDPKSPDTIYCGTGEANGSADSYPGVGLYKSTDAGATWVLIAASATQGVPRRIGVIAIDPFDSKHIKIGGTSHDDADPSAMFTSHDGGASWTRDSFISASNYWCNSIVFHPKKKNVIFATFDERGAKNGIYRTTDGGVTWTRLSTGLPIGSATFSRTSLAIAPSQPDTIYAQVASNRDGVLGIFVSTDMGNKWKSIGGTHFKNEGQMTYGNAIVVHPTNPKWVLCGGVDLHLTTNGGTSWKKVTAWDAKRGTTKYAHADHHALAMPAAAAGRVYDCNDGGMDFSEDGGQKWSNRSNGLANMMYYDADVAQSDSNLFGGGTQDNGTLITTDGKPDDVFEILGGDGGWMVIDPTTTSHVYASFYNMNIFRFRGSDGWKDVSPPEDDAVKERVWMVYIIMDPKDPKRVFTGSNRVWRTTDDGATWKAVSPVLDGSPINCIEVAAADTKKIYVGTQKGGFYRSIDGGNTWSGNIAGATLPGRIITRIEAHPTNADIVALTVGASSASTPFSHVFVSENGGTSWRDVDLKRLPNVPHNAIAFQTDAPGSFFVGNDVGVFFTPDLGSTWFNVSRNLPSTMIVDLVYHDKDRTLMAATYGRSLWRVKAS